MKSAIENVVVAVLMFLLGVVLTAYAFNGAGWLSKSPAWHLSWDTDPAPQRTNDCLSLWLKVNNFRSVGPKLFCIPHLRGKDIPRP